MSETPKQAKKLTFEQALKKLEQIVSEIEEGKVSLEQSIEKYADGIGLIKQCRVILDSAEQKIQMLSRNESGELSPDGELPDSDVS